jgi:Zn finger protein HypA/HybF involved in hydrogenase expression
MDKRTQIGKMIDDTKVVYFCINCSRRKIGDSKTDTGYCPICKTEQKDVLVIEGQLLVRK